MRSTWAVWLLVILFSGYPATAQAGKKQDIFIFRSPDGKKLVFDLNSRTISINSSKIFMEDCSDSNNICMKSDRVFIKIPRRCESENDILIYMNNTGPELFLSGMGGLSGSISKTLKKTDKFSYSYNTVKGIVEIVLIPESVDLSASKGGLNINPYRYSRESRKDMLACIK